MASSSIWPANMSGALLPFESDRYDAEKPNVGNSVAVLLRIPAGCLGQGSIQTACTSGYEQRQIMSC